MPLTGQAKTDYQREYMRRYQRRRRAKVAAEPVPKPRSAAPEPAIGLPDVSLLTEVTTQRDELRQQLDKLRRDLATMQEACFGCGRREDQVHVMFRGGVRTRDRVASPRARLDSGRPR
jgi:hypothetical protein